MLQNRASSLTHTKILLFILVWFLGVGPLAAVSVGEENPIVVGLPTSLSGNWAALGTEVVRGATLAQGEINRSGGLLGRQLAFDIQDTDEAVSPLRLLHTYRYLRARGITLFVGPTGTPGGLALGPIARHEPVLLIAPAVGVNIGFGVENGNLFNIQGGWEDAARLLAQDAFRQGFRRMGIFSSRHPFEQTQADAFQEEFLRLGGAIVARVDPQPDSADLTSEATLLVHDNPDAIFQSDYNQMATAARKLRELGFAKQLFAIQIDPSRLVGSDGSLEGAIFARLAKPNEEFEDRYKTRFGAAAQYPADFAYDAVMLLAHAVRATNSLDPTILAAALRGIHWNGASGAFILGTDGGAKRTPSLLRVSGDRFLPWEISTQ